MRPWWLGLGGLVGCSTPKEEHTIEVDFGANATSEDLSHWQAEFRQLEGVTSTASSWPEGRVFVSFQGDKTRYADNLRTAIAARSSALPPYASPPNFRFRSPSRSFTWLLVSRTRSGPELDAIATDLMSKVAQQSDVLDADVAPPPFFRIDLDPHRLAANDCDLLSVISSYNSSVLPTFYTSEQEFVTLPVCGTSLSEMATLQRAHPPGPTSMKVVVRQEFQGSPLNSIPLPADVAVVPMQQSACAEVFFAANDTETREALAPHAVAPPPSLEFRTVRQIDPDTPAPLLRLAALGYYPVGVVHDGIVTMEVRLFFPQVGETLVGQRKLSDLVVEAAPTEPEFTWNGSPGERTVVCTATVKELDDTLRSLPNILVAYGPDR